MRLQMFALVVFVLPVTARADDPPKAPAPQKKARRVIETYTDPAKAGPDFALQGEYRGEKAGGQIIADGEGQFTLRLFTGGLPGDGWAGGSTFRFKARAHDNKIKFLGNGFEAVLDSGKLTVTRDGTATVLDRVERKSPTAGLEPPSGARVLFDGKSADLWKKGKVVEDNLLLSGCTSVEEFKDFTLHLEFRTPFMPKATGQGRGNSGVYLQGRYEVQILDSFGLDGKDNECGGIYQCGAPKVNMCFPPLSWQTYDIDFTAARYDESGKKTANAVVNVKHNGVLVQDRLSVKGCTGGSQREEAPTPGPIYLQDHGNPVVFRNIWLVEKK
ncbi:MAG: DUF1080 domain-containing protein [Gemmataceae bacterium]|nr:DUF1080 domain-containing protein [Gemmataceae bacterium]